MATTFSPDVFPNTKEEVLERQRKIDIERTANAIEWIREMRTTPVNKLSKSDIFDVQQASYYINEMYEAEDVRTKSEGKHYPVIDNDLRKYIKEQAGYHRVYLLKLAANKKGANIVKISTFIVCLLTVMVFFTQGVATFAFGYDLWGNVADWGKSILGISENTPVSQGEVTVIKNGKTTTYKSISKAVDSVGKDILYPTYLPYDIYIDNITYIDNDSGITIFYHFNDIDYNIHIISNINKNIVFDNNQTIGTRMCYISEYDLYFQANFIEKSYLYTVISKEYNELVKIIEGLKYN